MILSFGTYEFSYSAAQLWILHSIYAQQPAEGLIATPSSYTPDNEHAVVVSCRPLSRTVEWLPSWQLSQNRFDNKLTSILYHDIIAAKGY